MKPFDIKTQRDLIKGLTEPSFFVKSYNNVADGMNLLSSKYNVDLSECLRIHNGQNGATFTIMEPVNLVAAEHISTLVKEIWVILYNNEIFPLQFFFMETAPSIVYKFLNYNIHLTGDSLVAPERTDDSEITHPRIMSVSLEEIPISKPYYQTLDDLIQFDEDFLKFKGERPDFAKVISKPEYVIKTKDFIIVNSEGDEDNLNYLMLKHSITGNRDRKKFTGVHHVELPYPPFYKDFQIIAIPDKNGVYKATFKIEKENGRIISKDDYSTMFPVSWSGQQLYFECYEAIKTKQLKEGSSTEYRSITPSGIPVKILYGPTGKFRTIYPIYDGDTDE